MEMVKTKHKKREISLVLSTATRPLTSVEIAREIYGAGLTLWQWLDIGGDLNDLWYTRHCARLLRAGRWVYMTPELYSKLDAAGEL